MVDGSTLRPKSPDMVNFSYASWSGWGSEVAGLHQTFISILMLLSSEQLYMHRKLITTSIFWLIHTNSNGKYGRWAILLQTIYILHRLQKLGTLSPVEHPARLLCHLDTVAYHGTMWKDKPTYETTLTSSIYLPCL